VFGRSISRLQGAGLRFLDRVVDALLGLALAAVAILVAFGPRPVCTSEKAQAEKRLARARAALVSSLLVAAFFLLVIFRKCIPGVKGWPRNGPRRGAFMFRSLK